MAGTGCGDEGHCPGPRGGADWSVRPSPSTNPGRWNSCPTTLKSVPSGSRCPTSTVSTRAAACAKTAWPGSSGMGRRAGMPAPPASSATVTAAQQAQAKVPSEGMLPCSLPDTCTPAAGQRGRGPAITASTPGKARPRARQATTPGLPGRRPGWPAGYSQTATRRRAMNPNQKRPNSAGS